MSSVAEQPSTEKAPEKAPEKTPEESKQQPNPLRAWPYPSADEVDLEVVCETNLLTKLQAVGIIAVGVLIGLYFQNQDFQLLLQPYIQILSSPVGFVLAGLNIILLYLISFRDVPVYLVDYTVYRHPKHICVTKEWYVELCRRSGFFKEEDIAFQEKLLQRTGLGDETAFIAAFHKDKLELTMQTARDEFDSLLGIVEELFEKTNVKPKDIGILVVNCSLFNPTPSMCARVINKFKMRTDIQSYNLSGMGCSASVLAVRLVRDLLQKRPNTLALVISTENTTQNWYTGSERNMLVSNALFRVGGAAMLLSNKPSDGKKARFQLVDTYRAHLAAEDEAYESIYQLEDPEGKRGVRLTQSLLPIVEKGLTLNLNYLGQTILPLSEKLKYAVYLAKKKLGYKQKPFTPDFKKAIQHFCIHAGGRGVIDGLEKTLSLGETDVAPSRATLWQFGNTSSSSIWYEFHYIEASGRVKQGDIIWQIALGSGFKCNSALWKALKTVQNKKKPSWI